MERKVAVAVRNLGDGVQRIVMAARMGGAATAGGQKGERDQTPDEWKIRVLQLLGGSVPEVKAAREGDARHPTSDLDVLLDNSSCDKFVLRCVENELPPNLIHCLRLLRVLELQHAHRAAAPHRSTSSRRLWGDRARSRSVGAGRLPLYEAICRESPPGRR